MGGFIAPRGGGPWVRGCPGTMGRKQAMLRGLWRPGCPGPMDDNSCGVVLGGQSKTRLAGFAPATGGDRVWASGLWEALGGNGNARGVRGLASLLRGADTRVEEGPGADPGSGVAVRGTIGELAGRQRGQEERVRAALEGLLAAITRIGRRSSWRGRDHHGGQGALGGSLCAPWARRPPRSRQTSAGSGIAG